MQTNSCVCTQDCIALNHGHEAAPDGTVTMKRLTSFKAGQGLVAMSALMPYAAFPGGEGNDFLETGPKRKYCQSPVDNGAFVKPLKQSFIKNQRLMPGTRMMICLLAGWAGHNKPIETTMNAIGGNLGRCRRQVLRYLKDAAEEGLLTWSKTKNRMGYITGIKIWLNLGLIRHSFDLYRSQKAAVYRKNQDVTQKSHINSNLLLNTPLDEEIDDSLKRFAQKLGLTMPDMSSA